MKPVRRSQSVRCQKNHQSSTAMKADARVRRVSFAARFAPGWKIAAILAWPPPSDALGYAVLGNARLSRGFRRLRSADMLAGSMRIASRFRNPGTLE